MASTAKSKSFEVNERKTQIQADIRRYKSACGCELGFAFMLGATIMFVIYINLGSANWSTSGWVLRGIMWVISMSTAGKLLGLAYSQVRLHMLRAALSAELQ